MRVHFLSWRWLMALRAGALVGCIHPPPHQKNQGLVRALVI